MLTVTPEYLAEQGLSPTFPERFWAKVDKHGPVPSHRPKLGPCWIWTGSKVSGGRYGGIAAMYIAEMKRTLYIRAHVGSFILNHGPVPNGKEVCHHCDNSLCVRPDHLWLGTHEENMHDCRDKRRARALNGELLALAFRVSRVQIHNIVKRRQRKQN